MITIINTFINFPPDVWGTVSDWMMVMVTVITAIFIWWTLRSQLKVQKLQERTSHNDNERFRLQIMPSFELNCEAINGREKSTGIDIIVYFELKLNHNPAQKITVSLHDNPSNLIITDGINQSKEFMNVGSNLLFRGSFHSEKGRHRNDNHHTIFWSCPLSIKVEFSDMVENKYNQFLIGEIQMSDKTFQSWLPTLIPSQG